MLIRDAIDSDLPAILAIYNDVILTSTAVYAEQPVTLDERVDWLQTKCRQGYPVLVAETQDGTGGFASFGDFRAWPGYRFTVEHSVHVRADLRGQGLGLALMQELIERAKTCGKHVLIAGIDAVNEASIRFHRRLGFAQVAHFHEVGFKFGRWLDLVFLELILDRMKDGEHRRPSSAPGQLAPTPSDGLAPSP